MGKVLVACEYSGVVRRAFTRAGHTAFSCDYLEADDGERAMHLQCDVFDVLHDVGDWDLIIAHPPCTYLAISGNRWHNNSPQRAEALSWTVLLFETMCGRSKRVAMENPVGVLSTQWRKASQYVQPYEFGHDESKKTGLWLHNLPLLVATHKKPEKIKQTLWALPPSKDRWKIRSTTFQGIADAMAAQWGPLL